MRKNNPIKETKEIRQARLSASFGMFKSKTWDNRPSHKQQRAEWRKNVSQSF
jgi:hypothetical protein